MPRSTYSRVDKAESFPCKFLENKSGGTWTPALVAYRVAVSAVVVGSFIMGGPGRTTSLFSDFPGGVPRDLPQVAIRVLKVARVPSIKGIVSILYDDRSCLARLLHYLINFLFRRHVLSKREFCWT